MAGEFTSIPVINYEDAVSAETKPQFLSALKHALVNVGFFYLQNPPIGVEVRERLINRTASFFELPEEKKQEVAMMNSKHFRGYSQLGVEKTAAKNDQRETLTVGFDFPERDSDLPDYYNLLGPNQWLPESTAPGLRQEIESYLKETQTLANQFVTLVAEALDLPPATFKQSFDRAPLSLLRIAAYPPPNDLKSLETQGVGPHKDGNFLTYLLQGTEHSSLEVQSRSGKWISAPPIPNTLVVNIGRSLETLTQGVCVATTHRVNLRPDQYLEADENASLGTRLSFPFFQMLSLDVSEDSMKLELPSHVLAMRGAKAKSDAETFFEKIFSGLAGEAVLINAITSYPEVSARWYPKLMEDALRQQHTGRELDYARLRQEMIKD